MIILSFRQLTARPRPLVAGPRRFPELRGIIITRTSGESDLRHASFLFFRGSHASLRAMKFAFALEIAIIAIIVAVVVVLTQPTVSAVGSG